MATLAFVLPIRPGKQEADVAMFERFKSGQEQEAFAAWNRSHGVKRHAVWHQTTPSGPVAIVLFEADDLERALGGMATAQGSFDQAFRDSVKEVHGVDLARDPPPSVTPVIDWRA